MLINRQRPRSPVPLTEKKIAQVLDGLKLRLSKLPGAEQEGVFFTSIKSAIEIVQLEEMKDEELHIQRAIDTARAAVKSLLDRSSRDPDSDEQHHRLEDIRQVLFAVVRTTLDTREKLEASGLRDLLDLTKRVEDTFPASAARFKWCSTQLRKFVTAKYKKPAQVTLDDQNKLESIVAETRAWTDSYPEESTVRDSWKPTLAYATTNQGFCSLAEVDEGFEQMAKAQEEKHFEFLALTAYTFLATAALTQNQVLLPIHQLKLFNEILQGLEKLDVNQDPKAVLRSYQTLEKVLYLMRIMMHRRPEYQQCSTSTVDTLLSLFPPSQRPSFKYPSIAKSMAENGEETDED
ncbi:uncharacterized protein IUM83_00087 [Phytophthora cinnamomi]|uniref:uncharacterized protein n=1 Tax=Phytophthora cinnamomi TaxID=4785 RepID=UPI00355A4AB9|nr:hypothetical protein IUM83_00087 [Phytophthora cinnamomi]